MSSQLERLYRTLPQTGQLQWIGIRSERGEPMTAVKQVNVTAAQGLEGDRCQRGKRQVTLIQQEHLAVIAALSGYTETLSPALLRRNLVVSGINLLALRNQRFSIGEVVLEGTEGCPPCKKMEMALGPGGFNAMRGHGGLCARVISGGEIRLNDPIRLVPAD
ncbi:MOSC domain-containing protein [Ferrimonas marina]|uniref:MOSC domain-containing protein YiiM n=1 Tax=Ferrimonas marina TaxID=299255 RepID=A0A1M5P4L6_9GAMM|nr:MOSC domain-containing protein [Ferrimonas marina]SHG96637.1 MOSC domain-containing protein YiiM [Ferrimonas marina]